MYVYEFDSLGLVYCHIRISHLPFEPAVGLPHAKDRPCVSAFGR